MAELKTFLFTDISGSVRLKDEMAGRSVTERDQAFIQSILTPHRTHIEGRLAEFGGRVVSTAGDGHFLVFDNTILAAQWAVSVQEAHRDEPILTPGGSPVEVRISMHVGVPQVDPGDPDNFVGKSVDYASRLNDYATGSQILVSRSVMAILDDVGLEGMRLHLHGRRSLKGIGNVEVHELLYDDHGPRPMRNQPKTDTQRQWTVVPTMGFGEGGGGVSVAGETALRRVGNYELEELLGSGGMGDVYKARHVQFGRVRAVKVIKQQFVTAGHTEVIRRFYNEIKAAGRLEHKNIVVAIDSSSPSDKVHYLVMEYVDGVSLDDLVLQHGPLGIAEACEIIRQAARGLQYIHKNDMVHRDVKPSNLMVTLVDGDQVHSDSTLTQGGGEGERAVVKILDLGLALLAVDSQDRVTRFDHKAMGTGMYMPPEQWKTTSVDIRADIYSLGCTLYHLLAGNPPFFDSDLRPEKAHEKSAAPPINSSIQPVPKRLWDVLRKMLEKRPEDRYATPAEVSAALAPFAEGHRLAALVRGHEAGETMTAAVTPTMPNGSPKTDTRRSKSRFSSAAFMRERPWVRNLALPLALMAVFIGGVAWLLNSSKERFRQEAEESRQKFLQEAEANARRTLPAFARTAAKGKLADEIAGRFAKLEELAGSDELVKALRSHNLDPKNETYFSDLNAWIGTLTHTTGVNVESWFVNDLQGYQVARSPVSEDSERKRYHTRDYFHGLGRNLSDAEAKDVEPLKRPHLSAVYESTSSKKLKVAFSVPIWDKPAPPADGAMKDVDADTETADDRTPLGVLAMSVNVADFEVLESGLSGGNEVVLVDLRPDQIEDEEREGLILYHPAQKPGELKRIDGDLLAQILAANPFRRQFNSEASFLTAYSDPFDAKQKYWGAFEPLVVEALKSATESDEAPIERGWIVLVQQPMRDGEASK